MLPVLDVNMALIKGDFIQLRNLVQSGSDINVRDEEERTALINCCLHEGENWALGSARLLLQHGAKLSLCDKKGRNALMYAIMYRRENLLKLFLDALDCDLTHTDKWNRTALWYADSLGNITITTMLKDILKKYQLETENSNKHVITKVNAAKHIKLNNHYKGLFKGKGTKTQYVLPYKTIPASIWEKRVKCYNGTGNVAKSGTTYLPALQTTTRLGKFPSIHEKSSSHPTENDKAPSKGNKESSKEANWREDLKRVNAILEIQLSSSYCSTAKLLPPNIRRYPKILKSETRENMEDELQRKRRVKNRRLSFDAFDVLQTKMPTKGNFRRCSVAVIPLIRFQNYKSPYSSRHEQQKTKSLLS